MIKKNCSVKEEKCVKGINCAVKSCEYHDGEKHCMAGCIAVGPENACCCSDTVCATYRRRTE